MPAKKKSSAGPRLSDYLLDVPLVHARGLIQPLADPLPRAPDAEIGRLAMRLLEALGSALTIIPRDRPGDTRRLLRLFAGLNAPSLHSRPRIEGGTSRPLWAALLALPDDQLEDLIQRARVAAALLDDHQDPSYPY